jgi:CheY-like chemotaxis protein
MSRRILVVEDNPDAGETLRDLLEMLGHEVEVVEDGAAGLEALGRWASDVVLCDIGLPGISGYDLARLMRAHPELRATPLVAVTGFGQPEDRIRSAAAGFDAHLVKPVDLAQLQEVLGRAEASAARRRA